jgi:hypothetical protein
MSLGPRLLAKLESPAADPDVLLKRTAAWVEQKYGDVLPKTSKDSWNLPLRSFVSSILQQRKSSFR